MADEIDERYFWMEDARCVSVFWHLTTMPLPLCAWCRSPTENASCRFAQSKAETAC
jgi:hypothetical protein